MCTAAQTIRLLSIHDLIHGWKGVFEPQTVQLRHRIWMPRELLAWYIIVYHVHTVYVANTATYQVSKDCCGYWEKLQLTTTSNIQRCVLCTVGTQGEGSFCPPLSAWTVWRLNVLTNQWCLWQWTYAAERESEILKVGKLFKWLWWAGCTIQAF